MELTLFWAANGGDVEEVKEILRNNPNVDVNWKDNATGTTALIRASMNGHDSVISVLLAHPDIDVNVSDSEGETPLMTACGSERVSCFSLLLEDSRVKVNQPNNEGWTPLRLLATGGQMSTIKWWIASGREMDLGKPGEENTDAIQQARWTEWWWSETAKEGKAKLATLLEKFKESPEETRYLVKLELGLLDELAAEIFALVVFVSDGLLDSRQGDHSTSTPASRFFAIATRLPQELQKMLCYRLFGSGKEIISGKVSEPAFKRLAMSLSH